VVIDYVSGRIQREVRPDRITLAHPAIKRQADAVTEQVKRLRDVTEGLLREHGKGIVERQFQQKRLSDAVSDIFAQIALLSRVTSILEDQGADVSGQEIYIAETFCTRATGRVQRAFDQIEDNDDERMVAIAKLALKRGEYGYALFED
jgi:acyl-CoA dehydrogenase family protein 9